MEEASTFSIAGRCRRTGSLGIAIASRAIAVGASCIFIRAGVGAVAAQGVTNPYLALGCLDRLSAGESPAEALASLLAGDNGRQVRQVSVVDATGLVHAHTGAGLPEWRGHTSGSDCSAAGNLLANGDVVVAMRNTFVAHENEHLAGRLLRALEAGQAAGGDRRGQQSAALCVVSTEAYADVDLRVDEHEQPLAELGRIWALYQRQLEYHLAVRCTGTAPHGIYDLEQRARLRQGIPF